VTATKDFDALQKTLSDIVGSQWAAMHKSHITVRPRTSEEISRILATANSAKIPVTARGGGTGWWGTATPKEGGILIDFRRMNEVLDIDEDAMTVTMEAGITFSRLDSTLSSKGYRIIIFPESGKIATVGGHIQTWGTGPHTSSVYEDQATQLVALKVVLPTGEVVQTGSGAVKTAAGNFGRRFFPVDIVGLFIGGEGAFGLITEVTLKLHKLPEAMMTRLVGFKDIKSAAGAMRQFQDIQRKGGLGTVVEQRLVSKGTLVKAIPRFEGSLKDAAHVMAVTSEGDPDDVHRHMAAACEIANGAGGTVVEDEVPEWWEGRFGLLPGAGFGWPHRILLVAMIPLGKFEEAMDLVEAFGKDLGIDLMGRGYPFAGPIVLVHAHIYYKTPEIETKDKALSLGRDLMGRLMDMGCIPHRVGTDFLPVLVDRLDPAYYALIKKIKQTLDPNGIMNPGAVVME